LIYSFHSSRLRRAVPVSVSCCRAKSPKLTAVRSRSRIAPRGQAAKPVCGCRSDFNATERYEIAKAIRNEASLTRTLNELSDSSRRRSHFGRLASQFQVAMDHLFYK